MTIDEAIKHARVSSERLTRLGNAEKALEQPCYKVTLEQAKEHEQLAEWLEELKRRREHDGEIIGSGALNNAYNQGYNKALDDFLAKLKERWREDCNCLVSNCGELRCEDCEIEFCRYADCVAEQLKEGGTDE